MKSFKMRSETEVTVAQSLPLEGTSVVHFGLGQELRILLASVTIPLSAQNNQFAIPVLRPSSPVSSRNDVKAAELSKTHLHNHLLKHLSLLNQRFIHNSEEGGGGNGRGSPTL